MKTPRSHGPKAEAGADRKAGPPPRDLDVLAGLLDDRFRVPGTNLRFGLDGIIGLLPGAGDWVTALAGIYVIGRGLGLRLPTSVVARMVGNVLLDLVVGAVPLVGDLFDFGFKANRRNVRLLQAHLAAPEKTRRGSRLRVVVGVVLVGVLFAGVLGGLAWTAVQLFRAVTGA